MVERNFQQLIASMKEERFLNSFAMTRITTDNENQSEDLKKPAKKDDTHRSYREEKERNDDDKGDSSSVHSYLSYQQEIQEENRIGYFNKIIELKIISDSSSQE